MKLLIVDDEPLARQRLRRMVETCPGWDVAGEAGTGAQALEQARATQPDLVLLDIQMPDMSGLAVARALAEQPLPPAVVFVTAYGEHALSAHQSRAAGYLLKPVRSADLAEALEQARRPSRAQSQTLHEQAEAATGEAAGRYIHASTHDGLVRVPLDEVVYFFAEHKYTVVHHLHGEVLTEQSLRSLEAELDDSFLRVHRKALVAARFIESLGRHHGSPHLRLRHVDEPIPVSRRRLADVRRLLAGEA